MKKAFKYLVALGLVGAVVFWFVTAPDPIAEAAIPAAYKADPGRGEVIYTAGGCSSCHAVPVSDNCEDHKSKDKKTLAGGRCFKTEFGTFYAPNISPDESAGIGGWSDAQFVSAMTRGVSPKGQHYYPAFPYTSYAGMRTEDVLDLKAYLWTLPKASKPAPNHEIPFPLNWRRVLGGWKLLFFDKTPDGPPAQLNDEQKRGYYLANTLAHCGECHTPRNVLGGKDLSRRMAGAATPDGKGYVPNITPHATGIKSWSEDDMITLLESGLTPEFDSIGGSMVAVQENMAKLSASDRKAIASYLKTVPPRASKRRPKKIKKK